MYVTYWVVLPVSIYLFIYLFTFTFTSLWNADSTAPIFIYIFIYMSAFHLQDGDVAHRPGERFLLQTEAAGMVHIHVNVIVKDFARNHIHVSVKSGSQAHDTVIRT